jgi:hypothetical protein
MVKFVASGTVCQVPSSVQPIREEGLPSSCILLVSLIYIKEEEEKEKEKKIIKLLHNY